VKSVSVALAAHIGQEMTTLATCLRFGRTSDGGQFYFTSHDQDIVFAGQTYLTASGYNASDVASSSDLNTDNLEVVGICSHPAITEEDLLAGLWDKARVQMFKVNWVDPSQGPLYERYGYLGEVRLGRRQFTAEIRGLMQAFITSIGRTEAPACPWNLGDERCKKDISSFIRTGTITGVNADRITLYDTASAEDGPAGGIAISGVSNADPAVVTTATAHGFTEGQVVTLSDIVGPTALNNVTVVRNPSGSTFELGVDTSDTGDYPAYVSGGVVTPMGGDAGYFDDGIMEITGPTGSLNLGLRREIKSYVPGQFTLQLPFPHPVEVDDIYSATPGCDKSLETCRDRFDNVVNMGGLPYLPGTDKIVQIGRKQ
jgi:uncharacterized phage protein (TIGR02218 family)